MIVLCRLIVHWRQKKVYRVTTEFVVQFRKKIKGIQKD